MGRKTIEENYHAMNSAQRFAYDFLVKRNGTTHNGEGKRNQDYFAFGQPVRAPGAGVVVTAVDGVDDNEPGVMNTKNVAGNHVVIDHGNSEFSFIAHLQKGTLRVKQGVRVGAGEMLALCGNSGNSSESHVHYHLQTTSDLTAGEGLPVRFREVLVNGVRVGNAEPVRGDSIEQALQRAASVRQ
jgi:murein DD-endopeptidase MepM/ murein hydrolase activator NlpD